MNGIKSLEKFKIIGLDANIFIYQFQQHPEFGPKSKIIFDRLSSHKLKAITSIISSIEVLSLKSSLSQLKALEELFFTTTNVTVFDISKSIAFQAAKIRRKYNFRTPDAIQLATAILEKAEVFVTNDQRLKQFKPLKVLILSEL